MITQYARVLQALKDGGVEFILIGGVAANLHGAARATFDVDVVYCRRRENIRKLVGVFAPFNPYLRGAPPGLPFKFDEQTVRNGLNFTLQTTLGDVDLLGEVAGGGNYDQLLAHTVEMEAFGVRSRVVTLERLIQLKRAAGRPKDFESLAELQALLEQHHQRGAGGAAG